jgi:hypothetical protein
MYNELMKNLLSSYHKLSCIISLKILFLNYHPDISPDNFGILNNAHGECFNNDISAMERDIVGLTDFTDVGRLSLDSNEILLGLCEHHRRQRS